MEEFQGSIDQPTNPDLLQNDWGHVNNLDLLQKELSNKNPAKKSTNTQKIEFWQAPNA